MVIMLLFSAMGCRTHKQIFILKSYVTLFTLCRAGKNSEYDQEIPQSQTADKNMAPRGRVTQQSRDTRKTNKANQPALYSQSR